jgi:Zn-dependent protease
MATLWHRELVLLRAPFPVTVGRGGFLPVAVLSLLFAGIAFSVNAPVAGAALLGAIGGTASLVFHEFGHLVAARRLTGVRPVGVSLIWLGAAARLEGAYHRGSSQTRVAIAGPATSFFLALALVPVLHLPLTHGLKQLVLLLLLFNVAVAGANLIPVNPLDGHKVIIGLLWSMLGSEWAARRLIRRLALAWIGLELLAASSLLVEKPALGATALSIAAGVFGQKLFVRRTRRIAQP